MKKIFLLVIVCELLGLVSHAQIASGGWPLEVKIKQSLFSPWYNTGGVNDRIIEKQLLQEEGEMHLKPLRFAHGFDVNLTPENSGVWTIQGQSRIWTLGIESTDAYSINLIFGKYRLPDGARLFVFSPDRTEILGAFTSENNTASEKLAVAPIAGDSILVQYEEPVNSSFHGELEISRIAHDYTGISLKSGDERRPMKRTAEYCNIDINCPEGLPYEDQQNSVCRIFIDGTELCTGVLVNNTASNGKPYVLTANHCIENASQAQVSLFLFNYESPYCGSIDGDNTHSISGSTLKAAFDSLDFSLVELSVAPPNYFRPYYAGWDVSGTVPASSYSIHHPMGDIKKIAIDKDAPTTGSYNRTYVSNSFWKILRWDSGVTEIGSSGGPLFNPQQQVIGTLTGGAAYCALPEYDMFEKLSRSWTYRKETGKQLKYWLDPNQTGETKINGYAPYSGMEKCGAYTNFSAMDTTQIIRATAGDLLSGYVSGTNTLGYAEFAEYFTGMKRGNLRGISVGVARKYITGQVQDAAITVKIYSGTNAPTDLLHTQEYSVDELTAGAMNYLAFNKSVNTSGNFFISFSMPKIGQSDTLVFYQAKRITPTNTFFIRNSAGWSDFRTLRNSASGSSLLVELVGCNVDLGDASHYFADGKTSVLTVFPNPVQAGRAFTVRLPQLLRSECSLHLYDMLGAEVPFQVLSRNDQELRIQVRNNRPGVLLLKLDTERGIFSSKISLVP